MEKREAIFPKGFMMKKGGSKRKPETPKPQGPPPPLKKQRPQPPLEQQKKLN
jgi:hypothetical protein